MTTGRINQVATIDWRVVRSRPEVSERPGRRGSDAATQQHRTRRSLARRSFVRVCPYTCHRRPCGSPRSIRDDPGPSSVRLSDARCESEIHRTVEFLSRGIVLVRIDRSGPSRMGQRDWRCLPRCHRARYVASDSRRRTGDSRDRAAKLRPEWRNR